MLDLVFNLSGYVFNEVMKMIHNKHVGLKNKILNVFYLLILGIVNSR